MIIAIDGPAAAGKGTLARRLSAHFGFAHLDTGALYRAVALTLRRQGIDPAADPDAAVAAARGLDSALFDDPALREEATGRLASVIAANQAVREALLDFQRRFAARPPAGEAGAVLDGRDVGTVVCPQADIKLFVTASAETRAERRFDELKARGEAADFRQILADVEARDDRDRNRAVAPLVPAHDAHLLDTTHLDIDAAFRRALALIEQYAAGQ